MEGEKNKLNLTHLSLFSGIGGIDLAAEWAGFETVAQVELNDYCRKVLYKHWPDVPKYKDVKDVTKESLELGPVTLISGGFPCQPYSTAGKLRGSSDDRALWPEMLKIIHEVKPNWVLGENVANFANMGLKQTLTDLEAEGYEATAFLIPACAVNAPHKRERVFIVANSSSFRQLFDGSKGEGIYFDSPCREAWERSIETLADSNKQGLQGCGRQYQEWYSEHKFSPWEGSRALETERLSRSGICRVSHGVPNRVDRLKALGNAVVPQQIYPILKAIAIIERCCYET